MISVDGKPFQKLKDGEKIAYCEQLLNDVKASREKRDLEWYLNHMFLEGHHYLTFNTSTSAIEANPPRRRGEVRMVVNKVRSSKRAIKNYITSSRPKWEVVPGDIDEETITTTRRYGKVLDFIYRKRHLESMVSGIVDSALDTSVGWAEVDWDPTASRGIGDIRVRLHPTFDIFIDRRAYLYDGRLVSPFAAKVVNRSLDEIAADERYNKKNRKEVKDEDEQAVSRMKARILEREAGPDKKTIKRANVKEFMLWDAEKNDKGGHIHLFSYAGDQALRDEDLDEIEYPLYCMQVDMNPTTVYQRAWVSDVIPLNKALDRSLSQKIMYANQALVFRLIAEKGHGVGIVTNESGEILEVSKNTKFEQMRMQPLPAGFDSLNHELTTYIEDLMGAHDAALGRLPSGARSGKTLEALQSADANNLTGVTQSLESFLSVVGERILDLIAKNYTTSRIVKLSEPEEGSDTMKVVGEGAPGQPDEIENTTVIREDNEVIVKIGSWLGYTKEAQLENIMRLAELGVLPAEAVLRHLEFPNVEELSQQAREERLEEANIQAEIAGRNQQGQEGQEEGGIDMQAMADKENMEMANGNILPPTEGATPEHSQVHRDFINSKTFQELPPEIQQGIVEHYQGEVGGAF